jgi:hypothetical protein
VIWEDDGVQFDDLDHDTGANKASPRQARLGAEPITSEEEGLAALRRPEQDVTCAPTTRSPRRRRTRERLELREPRAEAADLRLAAVAPSDTSREREREKMNDERPLGDQLVRGHDLPTAASMLS